MINLKFNIVKPADISLRKLTLKVKLTHCNLSIMTVQVLRTRVTQLFDIKHPFILPGMSWISTPQLVAAVSNAGGLGILATGPLSAEQTRESIREIRKLTQKPFGIGATLLMPGAKENAEVALEEQVPVINFSLGK